MHLKIRLLFLFYLFFVIYGSLVPLEYVYIPFDLAVERFINIQFLDLGITSRADWVANGLLFIPLTLLGLSAFWQLQRNFFNLMLILCALVISIGLPLLIEFTQLYFPARTVSQNDIIAEAIGGFTGIVIWLIFRRQFIALLSGLFDKTLSDKWSVYLSIYLIGMFAYSVMPLDLTLSPIELYRKWDNGLLILIPFSFSKGTLVELVYDLVADVVLWIPVTFFLIKRQIFSIKQIYLRILFFAFTIEFCQLFVFSRYTDITDIFTALLGAYLGMHIFSKLHDFSGIKTSKTSEIKNYIGYIGYLLWCVILIVVYWYPFNFALNESHVGPALDTFFGVPFESYYYGSEYLAITQLFRKVLFAMPLGVFMAISLSHQGYLISSKILFRTLALLIIFSTLFLFELVQMLVPGKVANLTDVFISFTGAVIGIAIAKPYFDKLLNQEKNKEAIQLTPNSTAGNNNGFFDSIPVIQNIMICKNIILVYCALCAAYYLPGTPYNVKELYMGGGIIGALGLTLVLFHSFGYPLAVIKQLSQKAEIKLKSVLGYVGLHIFITALLIRIFIPLESIHDIIGYPTWGEAPELEMLFRFSGFFVLISTIQFLLGLSLISFNNQYIKTKLVINFGLMFLFVVIPCHFVVVVVLAGTDNIVELLPNEGYSLYCLFLVLYILVTFWLITKVSLLLHLKKYQHALMVILVVIFSSPLMFYLVNYGTENFIFKYDKVFSAMQFLLSESRESYANSKEIIIRFSVAHTGLILLGILGQWPDKLLER